jgi:hypothetical protein
MKDRQGHAPLRHPGRAWERCGYRLMVLEGCAQRGRLPGMIADVPKSVETSLATAG